MIRAAVNNSVEPGSFGFSPTGSLESATAQSNQYGRVGHLESSTTESTPPQLEMGTIPGNAPVSAAPAPSQGGGGGGTAPVSPVPHMVNEGTAYQQRALAGQALGPPTSGGGGGGGGLGGGLGTARTAVNAAQFGSKLLGRGGVGAAGGAAGAGGLSAGATAGIVAIGAPIALAKIAKDQVNARDYGQKLHAGEKLGINDAFQQAGRVMNPITGPMNSITSGLNSAGVKFDPFFLTKKAVGFLNPFD